MVFRPGQSGNPAGKKPGTRNKATLAAEALFDNEAESLTRRCIEMAAAGDSVAMRLALDRIIPPRKERPVAFALPPLRTAGDAVTATAALVAAVGAGSLTPGEAAELSKLVDSFSRAIEVHDVQERLAALEAQAQSKGPPL
jgi:hypothetical protein